MNARTADYGLRFPAAQVAQGLRQPSLPRARAAIETVARPDWIDRLAAWAERQPSHHRLGSWMLMRHPAQ
jgi:hypothetical protein